MSAEEPRALSMHANPKPRAVSMHTAPVLLSWGMCRWIPPRISLSPELPVTLGSPSPYTAPSGALFHPPCRPPADLHIS